MIDKREILAIAQRTSLTPHVVEKDYVLGWILAGMYGHEELAESWIFKGGTCLKKCFFETYRFSEDLDFTLRKPEHLDANFLKGAFSEIGEWIYDQTGIEIPADKQEFDTLESEFRTYYFKRDGIVDDISDLDPGSDDIAEGGWGGLTEFSSKVGDVVAEVANRTSAETS